MLPARRVQRPRVIGTFEILTPAGDVFQFPRPTLLQHLLRLLFSHADTTIVSCVVLGLIWSAGFVGEAIGPLQAENCRN
jgi:hypothetical protein